MPISDQGVDLSRYMFVPRTLIFLTRGDEILLLKGKGDKRLWAGLYNGVGGHIEQGEDVMTAAKRELLEETGIASLNLWLCGIVTVNTQANPGVGIFIFKGEVSGFEPVTSSEGSLEWINVAQLKHIKLVADLPVLLPKILDSRPGSPVFFAHSYYDEVGDLQVALK